jgi:hypothetical protein
MTSRLWPLQVQRVRSSIHFVPSVSGTLRKPAARAGVHSTMRAVLLMIAVTACGRRAADPPLDREPLTPGEKTMPAWFGLPNVPAKRIAGRLLENEQPLAGRLHLRIDAPDATIWTGIDLDVAPDGRFDFGELRAGRYNILALATGKTSRVVEVDTRSAAADALTIYVYPCTPTTSTVTGNGGTPVAGAQVDLGGVVVATTDATGKFSVCINKESMLPTVRAVGYAAERVWAYEGQLARDAKLRPSIKLHGRVTDASGKPAASVAVQPVYVEQVQMSHGSAYSEIPVQVTTDAEGRFVMRGIPRLDRATGFGERAEDPAQYYFRVINHDTALEDRDAIVKANAPHEVVVRMAKGVADKEPTKPWGADAKISGRVLHNGKPLPDAIVNNLVVNVRNYPTRTKADGSFELDVRGGGRLMLQVEHATGLSTDRLVEVASGQHLKDVVIEVASTGKIEGVVVDGHGKPVDKATIWVNARETSQRRYAYTGPDGKFSINAEVGNTYDLEARDGNTGVRTEQEIKLSTAAGATGLRIVLGGARQLEGIAVDETGAVVKGASVLTNEPTFQTLPNGNSRSKGAWIPKGAAVRSASAMVGSTLYMQDAKTDASGRFTWSPISEGPYSITIITADGRVGVADDVTLANSPVRITVRSAGSIQVVCKNFRPMGGTLEDMNGGVAIVAAQRRFDVGCGETIGEIPEGRYLVTSKADKHKFVSAEVDVRPGATATATLEVKPAGTIKGMLLSYPGDKPLAGFECDAGIHEGGGRTVRGDPGATTSADGKFELKVSGGRILVFCDDPQNLFADGVAEVDLVQEANVTVRMVRAQTNGIDVGVDFEVTLNGARLTEVTKLAARAGLRVGDIVSAVDGASLIGLGRRSVQALAFLLAPGASATLAVQRDGKPLSIVLKVN